MIVAVLGAGGHAKVVVATLQAAGIEVIGVFDDDRSRHGSDVLGVRVRGGVEDSLREKCPLVIGVGSNRARKALAERIAGEFISAIHPHAFVHPSCKIGAGSVVFAGAVIQPDTVLGEHTIVNTSASVDHDCRVGAFAHVAPGVHVCGGVEIGEGALLGVGSAVIPGRRIGAWAVLGAGSVVTKDVEPGQTVVGVPARPQS
ncbi:MAG: acetyltransferase [Acidobacteriota bacterium]